MDQFELIRLFVRVYEAGSFSRAAQELGVAQPTVSKSVAQLERDLGVTLFQRSTRASSATEAAVTFYQRCKSILQDLEDARSALQAHAGTLSGPLRISAPAAFIEQCAADLIFEFRRRHPQVHVDLILDERFQDLIQDGIDVALRVGMLSDSSLIARRIAWSPYCIVGAPAYLAGNGGPPSQPEELTRFDWLRFSYRRGGDVVELTRGEDTRTVAVKPGFKVNSGRMLRAAAVEGLGLAQLPVWLCWDELRRGTLREVLPGWGLPTSPIHVIFPSAGKPPLRVRTLVDMLMEELRKVPSLDPAWREHLQNSGS